MRRRARAVWAWGSVDLRRGRVEGAGGVLRNKASWQMFWHITVGSLACPYPVPPRAK